jgi:YVTN family beta-propeller protein
MLKNKIKIQEKNIFLIVNVIVWLLISLFQILDNVFADEPAKNWLHQETLSEITNQEHSNQIAAINVGNQPKEISIFDNKIYVANYGDGTISVINGTNNTKIADIKVGKLSLLY